MNQTLIDALLSEFGEVSADLRKNPDPRQVKLDKIAALLTTYGVTPPNAMSVAVATNNGNVMVNPPFVQPPAADAKPTTKRERVRAALSEFLKQRGLAHRNTILDYLVDAGVMGHEKDPLQSLASYLSESKDLFAFDGKGNWYLRSMSRPSAGELPLASNGHHA